MQVLVEHVHELAQQLDVLRYPLVRVPNGIRGFLHSTMVRTYQLLMHGCSFVLCGAGKGSSN